MKTILTIIFTLVFLVGTAQKKQHWIENGCSSFCIGCKPTDTVTKCYVLDGKDSLKYTIETNNCNCDVYISMGYHKTHSCKGLKIHTIEAHFMYWCKDVTFVKGKKISQTKPRWDSNMAVGNTLQGEFEQNGKIAYVAKIHMLKYKLINHTRPYKFEAEWVTLNNY